MKINRYIILLLLCLMFQFSAYAEDTEKADPLGDAQIAIVAKDYKKAVKLLEPLVEEGNVRAKTLLASLIFKGAGVDKDVNKAIAMIMDAANKGDEEARKIAVDLNHEMASSGDVSALYNMGLMCLNWGDNPDSGKCLEWLKKGVELGHVQSAKFLAYIYKNGKYGITADQNQADAYSQRAQQLQQPQQSKK